MVPESSSSSDALIVDLGHVTVRNAFAVRAARNEIGSPAVMDTIHLNLQELRLYLAVITSSAMDVASERSLLNPLTFDLSVVRNLSTVWYTAEPDLTLIAKLGDVAIRLSHDVYVKAMHILFLNLDEGSKDSRCSIITLSTLLY